MLTMQQLQPGLHVTEHMQHQHAFGVVCQAGAWFRYRIAIVDLDLKQLEKIPIHYELDRDIINNARRLMTQT